MGCSETIYLIVRHNLSIVRHTNVIVEPVMFSSMIYCAAQLKLVRQHKYIVWQNEKIVRQSNMLTMEAASFMGLQYILIWIESQEKRVFCERSCEKL